jgi:hypothetical protein
MIHTKVLVYGVFKRSDGRGWVGELLVADVKELWGRELNGEAIEDGIPLPEGDILAGGSERVGGAVVKLVRKKE